MYLPLSSYDSWKTENPYDGYPPDYDDEDKEDEDDEEDV